MVRDGSCKCFGFYNKQRCVTPVSATVAQFGSLFSWVRLRSTQAKTKNDIPVILVKLPLWSTALWKQKEQYIGTAEAGIGAAIPHGELAWFGKRGYVFPHSAPNTDTVASWGTYYVVEILLKDEVIWGILVCRLKLNRSLSRSEQVKLY